MTKTWLITGASRGIGLEIAKAALERGDNIVATARKTDTLLQEFNTSSDRVAITCLDVQDPGQAEKAVTLAEEKFGKLDILVNNAGFGQLGYFETIDAVEIEQQFMTNVFGLMHVTRATLPLMRKQNTGHIINLSSIGGAAGFGGASIYCATKFAVEGFSESLAMELSSFGIKTTIVEPGYFRTDFLDSSSVQYGGIDIQEYSGINTELRTQFNSYNHQQPGDPKKLALLIADIAGTENPPLRLIAGSDALQMSRDLLNRRQLELDDWAAQAISTDYEKT